MRADEWAGWIVIAAFVTFVIAVVLGAAWVGGTIAHALAGLGL